MIKNCIKIRKEGLFYSVFDDDAKILNYLFDYKILNGRCGFPINAINKVINVLDEKKISYEVVGFESKDFKKLNNYVSFLSKSESKIMVSNTIDELRKKILSLKEDQIYELLDKIGELINEY